MHGEAKSERLQDVTEQELMEELARRRKESLQGCSDEEIETELLRRGIKVVRDKPPRLVEK